jgi:hypothetical protein
MSLVVARNGFFAYQARSLGLCVLFSNLLATLITGPHSQNVSPSFNPFTTFLESQYYYSRLHLIETFDF